MPSAGRRGQRSGDATAETSERVVYKDDVSYRSLRRSSSAVIGNIKKKLSSAQEMVRSRRALQTLNESPGACATPRLAAYRNPVACLDVTPAASSMRRRTPASGNKLSRGSKSGGVQKRPAVAAFVRQLHTRASKMIARRRISQLQTPRGSAKNTRAESSSDSTPNRLTRELNELVDSFRMLDQTVREQSIRANRQ